MAGFIPSDFSPEERSVYVEQGKRYIRGRQRALRRSLPEAQWSAHSRSVCERVQGLEVWRQAQGVALFWPMVDKREVDLRPLDAAARAQGMRVSYPYLEGNTVGFKFVDDVSELAERGSMFLEPLPDAPVVQRGEVQLVLVPALAFSPSGHRVGYGKGCYDAMLPDVCPPAASVIVGFHFQLLLEVPTQDDDFACDWLVTEKRVLRAGESVLEPGVRRSLKRA